jgi:hypothetical protein
VQQAEMANPGGGTMSVPIFGFIAKHYASFMQVVEHNGRRFVRDGYHRCYGLLTKGITRIPCVFIRAANFEQTGAVQPGFLQHGLLFGDRPPLIGDFLNDAVSALAQQRAVRKVVRISAQEFTVEL